MDEEVEAVEIGLCSTALAAAKLLRGGLMLDPAGFAKPILGVDSALSSFFIVFFMRSWPSFDGGVGGTVVGRSGNEKVVVAKDAPESLRELLRLFAGEAPS